MKSTVRLWSSRRCWDLSTDMQQDVGMCTASARPIAAQPLTDLQQNVLSGCPRLQLKHKTGALAAKPSVCSRQTPLQIRLKAIGLSQYADAFAKEEIDEEVLPCLTVQDLQSLGVCNRAHQRLILSAAVQPATQQVARLHSKPHPAASTNTPSAQAQPIQPSFNHISAAHPPYVHALSTHAPSKKERGACQAGSCRTDAVLPNKALPRGSLQGIASAVAANLTKAGLAAAPGSSRLTTAQQAERGQWQPPPSCKSVPAGATVAGAASRSRPCPPQASTSSKGSVRPVNGAPAIARGIAPAVRAVSATATGTSATVGTVAGTARHVVTTSEKLRATAKADGTAAEKAVATAGKGATTAGQAALLPAPQTKAEEDQQLAMALSASMGAGATPCGLERGLADPSQGAAALSQPVISQPASQPASQGVFSTMMAASRQKSKPVTPSSLGIPAEDTCCRSQEEQLLARIFASQASPSRAAVVLSSSQRLRACSSPAQLVSLSRSLWACAGCNDPPGCHLQERVQKRKAEAAMQAEAVKQQRAEQLRVKHCIAPDVALPSSQSEGQHTALPEVSTVDDIDRCSKSRCSAEAADCIVLTSPHEHAHEKSSEGRCLLSQPSQHVSQQTSARTMDPVKCMRLQALQQELKAARQTVADLEHMIEAEELS